MAHSNTQVAASDTGNGNTKLAMGKKTISLPSIRARVTAQDLKLDKEFTLDYTWAEWQGERYAYGDDCLLVNRQGIDRHMGNGRYGGEHHRSLTAYGLARLGVKSGNVDLTLMLPPGLFNNLKQTVIDAYRNNPVTIKLKGDKEARQWAYENVTIWPEGFAAVGCFMFDKDGEKSALASMLAGDVVLLDSGAYTANVFRLNNARFNAADLPQSSIPNGGGNVHIRKPMLEWVHSGGGDLTGVTLDDIDRALRLGSASGDYTLRFGSAAVDLKPELDYLAKQYADWLANNTLDSRFDGMRDMKGLLVVGGNADYILPHLSAWYPGKVIAYREGREFSSLHPADLNSVGALRMAHARLKAGK